MKFEEAIDELTKLKSLFVLLLDSPYIFSEWERLIKLHRSIGKQAHDARIAAAMNVHAVENLLTFNTDDFKRYSDITAINPHSITAP